MEAGGALPSSYLTECVHKVVLVSAQIRQLILYISDNVTLAKLLCKIFLLDKLGPLSSEE